MKCLYCAEEATHKRLCKKHIEIGNAAGALLQMGAVPTVELMIKFWEFLIEKEAHLYTTKEELPELMKEFKVINTYASTFLRSKIDDPA